MVSRFFVQRDKPRTLVPGGGVAGRNKAYLLRIGLYRLGWLFQRVKESGSVLGSLPKSYAKKMMLKPQRFSQPALQFTSDWQKPPVTSMVFVPVRQRTPGRVSAYSVPRPSPF